MKYIRQDDDTQETIWAKEGIRERCVGGWDPRAGLEILSLTSAGFASEFQTVLGNVLNESGAAGGKKKRSEAERRRDGVRGRRWT